MPDECLVACVVRGSESGSIVYMQNGERVYQIVAITITNASIRVGFLFYFPFTCSPVSVAHPFCPAAAENIRNCENMGSTNFKHL